MYAVQRAVEFHRDLTPHPVPRILNTESRILNPESRILNPPKGFTLVELLVVVSLVAIFASMLFSRVWFYQEMAEKAAMQQVVSALQTGLILQYGHRMASNQGSRIDNISTENPMDWLVQKPGNYAGEFDAIKPGTIEPGNWAFDLNSHELIYVPDHVEYFVPARNGVKWIRFRTRLDYEAGYGGKGGQVLTGVIFAPAEPYQWSIKEK